jgi:hypothetical protein
MAPKPLFTVPEVDNLDPVWPAKPSTGVDPRRRTPAEARAYGNARAEAAVGSVPVIGGVLKAGAQFANTLASPDTKVGIFTGPVNGISKLGNAIGDLVQGKPIDVKDAWTISDQNARRFSPWRVGTGQGATPADEAGLALGEGIGAELAGAATGATLLQQAARVRKLQQAAQLLQQSRRVQNAAVAIKTSPGLNAGANVIKNVGQAVGSTALATPFLDQDDGNLANLGDAIGLKLPGRVEPGENYLQALGKSIAVEGVAAPLALLGLGSLVKPVREGLAKGDLGVIDQLADAQLEPYRPLTQQPVAGSPVQFRADAPPVPGVPFTRIGDGTYFNEGPVPVAQAGAFRTGVLPDVMTTADGTQRPVKVLDMATGTLNLADFLDSKGLLRNQTQRDALANGVLTPVQQRVLRNYAKGLNADVVRFKRDPFRQAEGGTTDLLIFDSDLADQVYQRQQRALPPGRPQTTPALPDGGAGGVPRLPGYTQRGGELVPYDSAISRSLQEQTQIRQVQEQRQRLQDMGLLDQGEGGQLVFRMSPVDEARQQQLEALQAQREQLLRDAQESGIKPGPEVTAIDQQITDLIQAGEKEALSVSGEWGTATEPGELQTSLQGQSEGAGVAREVGVPMGQMPAPRYQQPELDMPDGRLEADTALAQLDELSDDQLRSLYNEHLGGGPAARQQQALLMAQQRVQALEQQLADVDQRLADGKIKPLGAKRMIGKLQNELALAQQELGAIEMRGQQPQLTIGEQLAMELGADQPGFDLTPVPDDELTEIRSLQWQRGQLQRVVDDAEADLRALRDQKAEADAITAASRQLKGAREALGGIDQEITEARTGLSPEAQLQLTTERWRDREEAASEFGYQTPDDYRNALQTWNRDQLRRLAMPESSPEVAALVLANTGRRVWAAKKGDIIDALVEISKRRGRYLPPAPAVVEQGAFDLIANPLGGDAPLFDRPADLSVEGPWGTATEPGNLQSSLLGQSGAADVVPGGPVPMASYVRRGMDAQTREQYKAVILQEMRDRGLIQPPITPVPQRPITTFQQGSFVDELLADPDGQLSFDYASGLRPVYEASGKDADTWLEEIRMRFEYNLLDTEAQKAQRDAYLAAKNWSSLTWEEQKRSGLLSQGFYSLQPKSKESINVPEGMLDVGPWRQPSEFSPELSVTGDRAPAPYRRGPDGVAANPATSGDTVEGLTAQIGVVQARATQLKGTRSKAGKAELAQQTALLTDLKTRLTVLKQAAEPSQPRLYRKVTLDKGGALVDADAPQAAQAAPSTAARPAKQAAAKDAPPAAKAPAAASQAAPANSADEQSTVGMGKAVYSQRNVENIDREIAARRKELQKLYREQTKGGPC